MDTTDNVSLTQRYSGASRGAIHSSDGSLAVPLAQENSTNDLPSTSASSAPTASRRSISAQPGRKYSKKQGELTIRRFFTLATNLATYYRRVIWICSFLAFLGGGFRYFGTNCAQREEALLMDLQSARSNQQSLEQKIYELAAVNKQLTQNLAAAEKEKANVQNVVTSKLTTKEEQKEKTSLLNKVEDLVSYKQRMHQAIQKLSKQRLLEKYGPGPHRLEIKLEFSPKSNVYVDTTNTGNTIIIETAPEEYMPHAVFWFMEQVDHGLWDYTSFHRNAHHVVQGGPTRNFLTPASLSLNKNFKDAGLESVLFQEYSAQFPHEKYTLGYAGRPGGPDFYISTVNNVKNHGPGGQSSYNDPSEADPCFAKVVEGFEVIERMHKSEVEPGDYNRMKDYVAIKHIRLMTGKKAK